MRSLFNPLPAIKSWLTQQWSLQFGRGFLWWPVWLGIGIAAYFSISVEAWQLVGSLACMLLLAFARWRKHAARLVLWPLFLIALGFMAGQVRTYVAVGPVLDREIKTARVSGVIEQIDDMDAEGRRLRFLLTGVELRDVEEAPRRVRVTLRGNKDGVVYRVGDRVEGLAGLSPPLAPVLPGGFDFRRHMAFQGIGALGFFYYAPDILEDGADGGFGVQRLRQVVAARVKAVLPGETGSVAVALLTGKRTGIVEADLDAMRGSGLAHMLAISGLHVGLFSGVVFFVLRLLMAMVPGLALRWPIKKIAAVLAFGAAVFYMLLAGATIPTQRAVLMVGVVFLAVLLDRTALSMRLVAFAAFVVLLLMPESLLSVSFQLSFAAVVALIWVYDLLRGWFIAISRQSGVVRRALIYVGSVCLTTVVATIATAPFALYHFQTLAVLSVIANVLAMPVMSILIMPFAVVTLTAMTLRLEALPLWVMGQGVEAVLWIAHAVSDQEYAVMRVAAWPFEAFLAASLGALFFVLVRGRFKLMGVVAIVVAGFLVTGNRQPDILVSEKHEVWAFYDRGADQLYVSARNKQRFVRENWERAYGAEGGSSQRWDKAPESGIVCDGQACRLEVKGRRVSFVRDIEALPLECEWADVLVSARSMYLKNCAAKYVIDHQAVKRDGVHAIWVEDTGIVVDSVGAHFGERVWH